MIIVILAGRKFPPRSAEEWLAGRGKEFLGKGFLWRLGATSPVEELLLDRLLKKEESVEVHVPYTVASHPISSRYLLEILQRRGQVVEWWMKDYPYGSAYQRRNTNMLAGAKLLVAFYDNREGALERTIKEAQVRRKKIILVKEG